MLSDVKYLFSLAIECLIEYVNNIMSSIYYVLNECITFDCVAINYLLNTLKFIFSLLRSVIEKNETLTEVILYSLLLLFTMGLFLYFCFWIAKQFKKLKISNYLLDDCQVFTFDLLCILVFYKEHYNSYPIEPNIGLFDLTKYVLLFKIIINISVIYIILNLYKLNVVNNSMFRDTLSSLFCYFLVLEIISRIFLMIYHSYCIIKEVIKIYYNNTKFDNKKYLASIPKFKTYGRSKFTMLKDVNV